MTKLLKTNSKAKRKVAIIGSVGLPANYGGFETLTEHLVDNLSKDYDITVYCSSKKYPKSVQQDTYKGAKMKYIPLEANGLQSIFYDSISIIHSLFYADVLLILGVAGAFILPFVKLFTNKKIIISIDGIEWKRAKWHRVAKWYLFWAESMAVKYSHIDISDNEAIQDYTAMRYGSLSRIVEYGANHTIPATITEDDIETYPFLAHDYAFKVCRIEPENNVHEILETYMDLPEHTLVVVGNWNNSEYGKLYREKCEGFENIHLLDPIYDQHKLDVLRSNATIYIHGHSAGGTNPSLVEAMYLGLPIFAFNVSYNRKTTEGKALYFNNQFDLTELIENTSKEELKKLGENLKEIAVRRYDWRKIALKYGDLFEEAFRVQSKKTIHPSVKNVDEEDLLHLNLAHLKYHKSFYEKNKNK
jgi:glycosyltransferase involved in cell wall biosynthesis